jgi:hypothetical protein
MVIFTYECHNIFYIIKSNLLIVVLAVVVVSVPLTLKFRGGKMKKRLKTNQI